MILVICLQIQLKRYGQDYRISTISPTRDGYVFAGWSESENGEMQYTPGDIFTENRNLSLYPVWKIKGARILITTTSNNVDNSMLEKFKKKLAERYTDATIKCVTKEEGERYIQGIVDDSDNNYFDLVIINNRVWDLPAGLINELSKKTNVFTISNDAQSNLDIIKTAKALNQVNIYPEMTTKGKEKIGIEIKNSLTDSFARTIEFVEDVELFYTATYVAKDSTYRYEDADAIGAMKVQGNDGQTNIWVHSQLALKDNLELATKLVSYALGEIEGIGETIVTSGLIRNFDANNNLGSGHSNSTTIWKDLSENNNGTINGATFTDEYLTLDGVDDWVNIGEIKDKDYMTIEAKIMLNDTPTSGYHCIISNYNNGGMGLDFRDKDLYVQAWIDGEYRRAYITNAIEPNTVYNISGTYDGNSLKLYINGSLVATTEIAGKIGNPVGNTIMAIGANPDGNSVDHEQFSNIRVYNARVYERALTQAEIKQNINATK